MISLHLHRICNLIFRCWYFVWRSNKSEIATPNTLTKQNTLIWQCPILTNKNSNTTLRMWSRSGTPLDDLFYASWLPSIIIKLMVISLKERLPWIRLCELDQWVCSGQDHFHHLLYQSLPHPDPYIYCTALVFPRQYLHMTTERAH